MVSINIKAGSRIWFQGERQGYTVRTIGERYAICTKPFNPRNTVLYTIIDMNKMIRGTENLIFGMGAETLKDCEEMLDRLEKNETEISYRNNVPFYISKIIV